MKNPVHKDSSGNQGAPERASYFSDALSTAEIEQLLHPSEPPATALAKDMCPRWQSVFADQAHKTHCHS